MNSKRCFTMVHCDLHKDCKWSHAPHKNGYFQPTQVGEHCHHFTKLEFKELPIEERAAMLAGSHE